MTPMVALLGVRVIRSAHVELRVDPEELPSRVWLLDGVPALAAAPDDTPRPPFLTPVGPGRYAHDFPELMAGKVYGMRWQDPGEASSDHDADPPPGASLPNR